MVNWMKNRKEKQASDWWTISILVLVIGFQACVEVDSSKGVSSRKVTQDRALFFKNMRQSYYDVQELKEAGINIYRHKGIDSDGPHASINYHWRDDQASMMFYPGISEDDEIVFRYKGFGNDSSKIFDGSTIENHLETILFIYNGMQNGHDIVYSKEIDLFKGNPQKEVFGEVVKDYLMLTGNIR